MPTEEKLFCPHVKESFEMNDLHNTRCIQFTFYNNIGYVALTVQHKKAI